MPVLSSSRFASQRIHLLRVPTLFCTILPYGPSNAPKLAPISDLLPGQLSHTVCKNLQRSYRSKLSHTIYPRDPRLYTLRRPPALSTTRRVAVSGVNETMPHNPTLVKAFRAIRGWCAHVSRGQSGCGGIPLLLRGGCRRPCIGSLGSGDRLSDRLARKRGRSHFLQFFRSSRVRRG